MIRTSRLLPLLCLCFMNSFIICGEFGSSSGSEQESQSKPHHDRGDGRDNARSDSEEHEPTASQNPLSHSQKYTSLENERRPADLSSFSSPRLGRRKKSSASLSSGASSRRKNPSESSANNCAIDPALLVAAQSLNLQDESGPVARAQPGWLSSFYHGALGMIGSQRTHIEAEITNNTFLNTYPNEDARTKALWAGLDDLSDAFGANEVHKYPARLITMRSFAKKANIPVLERHEKRLLKLALAQRQEADNLIVAIMMDPKNKDWVEESKVAKTPRRKSHSSSKNHLTTAHNNSDSD